MEFNTYQREARKTAIYPEEYKLLYTTIGLCGEAGELANKVKKKLRGDGELDMEGIVGELGDILWYLSQVAADIDVELEHIAAKNIEKLKSRQERGVTKGNGDYR